MHTHLKIYAAPVREGIRSAPLSPTVLSHAKGSQDAACLTFCQAALPRVKTKVKDLSILSGNILPVTSSFSCCARKSRSRLLVCEVLVCEDHNTAALSPDYISEPTWHCQRRDV